MASEEAERKAARIKRTLAEVAEATQVFRRRIANIQEFPLGESLEAVLEVAEHCDAFGCFIDPTGWTKTKDDREFNGELLELVAAFDSGVAALLQKRTGCNKKDGIHQHLAGGSCPLCGERLPDRASEVEQEAKP